MGPFKHALLHIGMEIAKEHLPVIGIAVKEVATKVAPYAGPTAILLGGNWYCLRTLLYV